MQILELTSQPLNLSQYKARQALESDYQTLITESTIGMVDGEPRMVYVRLEDLGVDASEVVTALQSIRFSDGGQRRTNGVEGRVRSLGWHPRRTMRQDFCHIAVLAEENPAAHGVVCSYAQQVSRWYEQFNPAVYAQHEQIMREKISPDYQVPQTVFTSGVINKDYSLPYHFDTGNFKDVWSCMLGFKRHIKGGHLAVPEYGVGFEICHNSLFMFDGQGILHGVTPIEKQSRTAYRYTIVYYSLQQIWNCLPITDELIRIRQKRTEREQRRAAVASGQLTPEEAWPDASKKRTPKP